MVNFKEDEKLNKLNHSCAHLLAQAVKHLYPEAKFWVGPVVEEGFYYDIDLGDKVITEEDIPANAYSASHSDLSEFGFPGVKRIPNQIVKADAVMSGTVLLVKAPFTVGRRPIICAYLRPSLVLEEARRRKK